MESTISKLYRTRVAPSIDKTLDKTTKPLLSAMEKVPSEAYLAFGLACCCTATGLALSGKTKAAIIVGVWAPTALLVGMYAKHHFDS